MLIYVCIDFDRHQSVSVSQGPDSANGARHPREWDGGCQTQGIVDDMVFGLGTFGEVSAERGTPYSNAHLDEGN